MEGAPEALARDERQRRAGVLLIGVASYSWLHGFFLKKKQPPRCLVDGRLLRLLVDGGTELFDTGCIDIFFFFEEIKLL